MRHHSTRGVGIRYLLALTLPVTGLALVVYTIVQLVIAQRNGAPPAPRREQRAALAGAAAPLPDLGGPGRPVDRPSHPDPGRR